MPEEEEKEPKEARIKSQIDELKEMDKPKEGNKKSKWNLFGKIKEAFFNRKKEIE